MSKPTITASKQQIDQLRNMFIEKYEKNPPEVPFHHVDIDRVRNDDVWCNHFLDMYDFDMTVAFDKLWSTCIWRKEFGANDLDESKLNMDILKSGVIFPHNKDVDGKTLLIFKTKKHVKGAHEMNEIFKVLVYWVERIHRETHLDKCTIFFDMDGTGLTQMDLEFIKMIIETFKQYYPNALNYIIVFEMAWVLNAAFKIVKALLPEKAVEILKIISKKNLNTYVDKDNSLASWGGNDKYDFTFVPEKKKTMTNGFAASAPSPNAQDEQNNNVQDKKVHFANSSPTRLPAEQQQQQTQMHDIPEPFTTKDHEMLRVSPQDYLKFTRGDSKESKLELTCISHGPVTYKIQTTSPEKFRVRPRCGILNPGECLAVNILLKPEQSLSENGKDKFLIMCLPCNDIQLNQIAEYWKKNAQQSANIEQHRLCCAYVDSLSAAAGGVGSKIVNGLVGSSVGDGKAISGSAATDKLEQQLRYTQFLQIVTLVFLLILSGAVIYLLKLQLCSDGGCLSQGPSGESVDFDGCSEHNSEL